MLICLSYSLSIIMTHHIYMYIIFRFWPNSINGSGYTNFFYKKWRLGIITNVNWLQAYVYLFIHFIVIIHKRYKIVYVNIYNKIVYMNIYKNIDFIWLS